LTSELDYQAEVEKLEDIKQRLDIALNLYHFTEKQLEDQRKHVGKLQTEYVEAWRAGVEKLFPSKHIVDFRFPTPWKAEKKVEK
jgi:hypothetical protein